MERTAYLMNSYLKYYLTASILTLAVGNFNTIADAIIMGHFLGPEALSAINVSIPVIRMEEIVFSVLLVSGASLLVAQAIGRGDLEEVSRVFTVSMTSLMVLGIVSIFLGLGGLADYLANWLCVDDSLLVLTTEYVYVSLLVAILLMFANSIGQMVDVAGNPRLVAKSMIANAITNIICDLLFVPVMGFGIGASALSSGIGCAVGILVMLRYLLSSASPYKLVFKGINWAKVLKANLINGITPMLGQISMLFIVLVINYFVQKNLGADGMFTVSVGIQEIEISFMLVSGTMMGFFGIGGMLTGQKDIKGLGILYKTSMKIVIGSVIFFTVLSVCMHEQMAILFGANRPELFEITADGLPKMVLIIPALVASIVMSIVHQVVGHQGLSQIEGTLSLISIAISLFYFDTYFASEYIWYAFPTATVITILIVFLLTEFKHRKLDGKIHRISLIPFAEENKNVMDVSIPCSEAGMQEALAEIAVFCQHLLNNRIRYQINLCVEELLKNVINYSGRNSKQFIDIKLAIEADEVVASIRDNGLPFDPTKNQQDKETFGLKLVNKYCSYIRYNDSFGQNMTIMKWKLMENDKGGKL